MANYTELVGINNSQDVTISNILLENFISFYDWGFYNKGGFININAPASGAYGGSKSILKPQRDPNYADGKVWQGYRPNWVWESSAEVGSPIPISGVYVNNSLVTSGYKVDYINGRIIMDSPLPLSSTVSASYSHKWINIVPGRGVPWLREIQKNASRVDDTGFGAYASGNWAQLGQTRIPLPAITVEVVPPHQMAPYQLGGGQLARNDVIFNVIAENDWECANILDVITHQNDRNIYMYNPNKMGASGVSVFNHDNTITDFGLASGTFPSLVENFRYQQQCYIYDSNSNGISELNPNLYIGVARCKTEVRTI